MEPGPAGGTMQDQVNKVQQLVVYLGNIVKLLTNLFPRVSGSFTMPVAATLSVADVRIQANSIVFLTPTNASAGTLMGSSKSLYISAVTSGVGFTVKTADGTNAAGTETFNYIAYTPA